MWAREPRHQGKDRVVVHPHTVLPDGSLRWRVERTA
jgi:hypothetical protein